MGSISFSEPRGGVDRRAFLAAGFRGVSAFLGLSSLTGCNFERTTILSGTGAEPEPPSLGNIGFVGPLQPPDHNGLMLPRGFTSRVVARSGEPVLGPVYRWHDAPDGGACFPAPSGGWAYVSNAELPDGQGGAGALLFDRDARVVGAYSILEETMLNCAGGRTPWGSWLSCEEHDDGVIYECDPFGLLPAEQRRAMGVFRHEAAAVDSRYRHVYLTEDQPDGRLYRFVPEDYPDLTRGTLEVAEVEGDRGVSWHRVPDPTGGAANPTRYQIREATIFAGGEGIGYYRGVVFFATRSDQRVWAYDTFGGGLSVVYDAATAASPILTGVDNLLISPSGDVLVAEDSDDLQIVALTPQGSILPLVQLVGHDDSEITGPAFDPSHRRLYFSSQRGTTGRATDGVTFEVTGPFTVPLPPLL